jgi:hypothetical protein
MFSPHSVGSSYYALPRGALWPSCGFLAAFLQRIIVDTVSQCRDTETAAICCRQCFSAGHRSDWLFVFHPHV